MSTKKPSLDDIGRIGGDRPFTKEDARAVSAFIEARKAERSVADARRQKALERHMEKVMADPGGIRSLDDIGFIGGGPPPTEEDLRAISAWVQAMRIKRSASRAATRRKTAVRKPKAKARAARTRA